MVGRWSAMSRRGRCSLGHVVPLSESEVRSASPSHRFLLFSSPRRVQGTPCPSPLSLLHDPCCHDGISYGPCSSNGCLSCLPGWFGTWRRRRQAGATYRVENSEPDQAFLASVAMPRPDNPTIPQSHTPALALESRCVLTATICLCASALSLFRNQKHPLCRQGCLSSESYPK